MVARVHPIRKLMLRNEHSRVWLLKRDLARCKDEWQADGFEFQSAYDAL